MISMVPVKKFFPYIASVAGEVPEFLIQQMLAATAADMCQQTGCISTDIVFTGKAGEGSYTVPLPNSLETEVVRHVYVDGRELATTRLDELSMRTRGYDWSEFEGQPRAYVMKDKRTITLVPRPSEDCSIRVVAYASVMRDAVSLPSQFFTDYLDVLVEGTLARVYRVAGQVFSNSQLAQAADARYNMMLHDVKSESVRDFSRKAGRVEFNRII